MWDTDTLLLCGSGCHAGMMNGRWHVASGPPLQLGPCMSNSTKRVLLATPAGGRTDGEEEQGWKEEEAGVEIDSQDDNVVMLGVDEVGRGDWQNALGLMM